MEVPLSYLMDHIKDREGTLHGPDNGAQDVTTLLYLAQKDVQDIFPSLALDPTHLPVQVMVCFGIYWYSHSASCALPLSHVLGRTPKQTGTWPMLCTFHFILDICMMI